MQTQTQAAPISKKALWIGWIMTALPVIMLLMSGVRKLVKPGFVVEGFNKLGLPENLTRPIGILELACTAVLGAILLAGYLGGAILTHLRVGEAVFAQILFGVIFWGGLFLFDSRLRVLIPLCCKSAA